MTFLDWARQFPASITVWDRDGMLVEMNDRAAEVCRPDGGRALIGKNILDCHPETARIKTQRLMETQTANAYTIEKNGVRKLIYQAPGYQDGTHAGLLQICIEIPSEFPHFVRS